MEIIQHVQNIKYGYLLDKYKMGHLEGNFTPVLYIGRKVPKGLTYHQCDRTANKQPTFPRPTATISLSVHPFILFSRRLASSDSDVEPVNMAVTSYLSHIVSKVDVGSTHSTETNHSHMAS